MPNNIQISEVLREGEAWLRDHGENAGVVGASPQWNLRALRAQSQVLEQASSSLGNLVLYGVSQAGKSYVVSTLAADKGGCLEIPLGGKNYDFIDEINPPGGEESTGVVTRFTFSPQPAVPDPGFPVHVKLMNEADVIKTLINSYLNDVNHVAEEEADLEVENKTAWLQTVSKSSKNSGMDADDILGIREYLKKYSGLHIKKFDETYWVKLIEAIPYLDVEKRCYALSPLWGNMDHYSDLYKKLREGLERLEFSSDVYCPIEKTLIPRSNGILKVSTLAELVKPDDEQSFVEVCLTKDRQIGIPRALLTALCLELVVDLSSKQKPWDLFAYTDLLDFPGCRSRKTKRPSDIPEALELTKGEYAANVLLRGKVDYLFNVYLEQRDLTSMVVCLPETINETEPLLYVIEKWSAEMVGTTPEVRSENADLATLWMNLTKFDMSLMKKKRQLPSERWEARFKSSLYDPFNAEGWFTKWAEQPFNNTLCFRNTREGRLDGLFTYDSKTDIQGDFVLDEGKEWFEKQEEGFLNLPLVQKHVREPQKVWDNVWSPDGGVEYCVERISRLVKPDLKERQLESLFKGVMEKSRALLKMYHRNTENVQEELKKCAEKFEKLSSCLQDEMESGKHAAFFLDLMVSEENAYQMLKAGDFYLKPAQDTSGKAKQQVEYVMSAWNDQLLSLTETPAFLDWYGLEKETADFAIQHILEAARRVDVRSQLVQDFYEIIVGSGSKKETLVIRSKVVTERLSNFISKLGLDSMEVAKWPESKVRKGCKIFTKADVCDGIPTLASSRYLYENEYVSDWLTAFYFSVVENLNQGEGGGFDVEANAELGKIIGKLSWDQENG
ncbi:virulence factor SrfC family protein [Terasakiella sp. SH-1]|uniref:virulence factor SrfC family protein n=1 Tax=Terasakiella sp. SH-1 TaxID=2560057 RepID=UPI0010748A66|nr:virulence factor SrfC family protein [Terasakiella sp. SH-1]